MSIWWAGYNVQVDVNSVALAVKRVRVRGTVTDLDVTNTEGQPGNPLAAVAVGFAGRIPGIADCEIVFELPTFDSAANPFQAPRSLVLGAYPVIRVWKQRRGVGVSYQMVPLVCEVDDDADVKGLQVPSFTVRSDGLFQLPAA